MAQGGSGNLWHTTASEAAPARPALAGAQRADLVVIGGGFTGCSAALHAAEVGARVVLLEADVIGQGASGRNAGYVNAGLWTPPDDVEALIGQAAGTRLNAVLAAAPATVLEIIRRHGIACDAARVGSLHLAHSPRGLADLRRRLAQQQARGAPVTLLTAGETAERTGTPAYLGALHDDRAAIIQPFSYCRGLARAATSAGAALHEQSRVVRVGRQGTAWLVDTGGGNVTAPLLINATDAYHIPFPGLSLPAMARTGYFQVSTTPLSREHRRRILPRGEGCWDTATVMTSFRLDRDGRLVLGAAGSLGHAADGLHLGWARRKMAALFPFLRDQPFDHVWHGTIGMTADHLPKVLRLGQDALAAFGYSGRGIGPGTVFGKALALSLLNGDPDALPLPPLDAHRERFERARQVYYETGCALTHMVASRWGQAHRSTPAAR